MSKKVFKSFEFQFVGKEEPFPPDEDLELFELQAAYTLHSSRSVHSELISKEVNEDDIIEISFNDGTVWMGDYQDYQLIFPLKNSRSPDEQPAHKILIPEFISPAEGESVDRNIIPSLFPTAVRFFVKKAGIAADTVRTLARKLENQLLDDLTGLYYINHNFGLQEKYHKESSDEPFLLFIHGTSSSTKGSFGDLWLEDQQGIWADICGLYPGRILGFQHRSLTESPFVNLLQLIDSLPAQITLDIVSHSRGGIIADWLVRFSESKTGVHDEYLQADPSIDKDDIEAIHKIRVLLEEKQIHIRKLVRVACPAGGTSLMGERINVLNVILNLISKSLGAAPAAPVIKLLKEIIAATVSQKNNTDSLPGLQAMDPKSYCVKLLRSPLEFGMNNPNGVFGNQLWVIAGKRKLEWGRSMLQVIVSRIVYMGENDFVVNTISMYHGAPRMKKILHYVDDSEDVSHFHYFRNAATQTALMAALTQSAEETKIFTAFTGTLSDDDVRGLIEYGNVYQDKFSGRKPVVFILPGIMGSNIQIDGQKVWINYWGMFTGQLEKLDVRRPSASKAIGVVGTSYKKLIQYLEKDYDVITHPFDWRMSLEDCGRQLIRKVREVKQVLDHENKRNNTNHSIRFIAHSMGGLVAREVAFQDPVLWKELNGMAQFQMLLLGTPWLGSFRIPYVLAGKDTIIKVLGGLDMTRTRNDLINMFSKFEGLMNLLPVDDRTDIDFSKSKTWSDLISAAGMDWEVPEPALLQKIAGFKKRVQDGLKDFDYSKVIYIAGKDKATRSSYHIINNQLEFLDTPDGDQSVTWETGIPQAIQEKKQNLYYVEVSHGALANEKKMFEGIRELLHSGSTTQRFFQTAPISRAVGTPALFAHREEEVVYYDELYSTCQLLGIPVIQEQDGKQLPPLKISITNGDLKVCRFPILLSHFDRDGILNAEAVADRYLDKALSTKHQMGVYPGQVGTHELFINDKGSRLGFKGCIVVGLGEVDSFSQQTLSLTVEKACISYLLEMSGEPQAIGISSLLLGSSYGKLSIENSILAVLQGINHANAKIRMNHPGLKLVEYVEFIELYEDKAISCFFTVNQLIRQNFEGLTLQWADSRITQAFGKRKRLTIDNTADWWQRVNVLTKYEEKTGNQYLTYLSSTTSAREETQNLKVNVRLIDELIQKISAGNHWESVDAKVIFELLIPNAFKENISTKNSVLWVVDEKSAAYPWELLQPGSGNNKPLCISARMIRQLSTRDLDNVMITSRSNAALIIGDPDLEGATFAAQLPNAQTEAHTVFEYLKKILPDTPKPLMHASFTDILRSVVTTDAKVLHIAAHGVYNAEQEDKSGIIIGKGTDNGTEAPLLLTTSQVDLLPYTPELVFINCCFSGSVHLFGSYTNNKVKLAANIGIQWIKKGVKAAVITGWEVNDAAAEKFAQVFYSEMCRGAEFGTAVKNARAEVYKHFPNSNTWGAYQCYGDPFYKLVLEEEGSVPADDTYLLIEEALNDLENLIHRSEIDAHLLSSLQKDIYHIRSKIEKSNFDQKEMIQKGVLEQLSLTFSVLNLPEESLRSYEELFQFRNSYFDIKSYEKFLNLKSKVWVRHYIDHNDPGTDYVRIFEELEDKCRSILNLSNALEQNTLMAGIYKRYAVVARHKDKLRLLKQSEHYYQRAYEIVNREDAMYENFNKWILQKVIDLYTEKHKTPERYITSATFKEIQTRLMPYGQEEQLIEASPYSFVSGEDQYWKLLKIANSYITELILSYKVRDKQIPMLMDKIRKYAAELATYASSVSKQQQQDDFLRINIALFELADARKLCEYLVQIKGFFDQ